MTTNAEDAEEAMERESEGRIRGWLKLAEDILRSRLPDRKTPARDAPVVETSET